LIDLIKLEPFFNEKSLMDIDCHWWSLMVIGVHWLSLIIIICNKWQRSQWQRS